MILILCLCLLMIGGRGEAFDTTEELNDFTSVDNISISDSDNDYAYILFKDEKLEFYERDGKTIVGGISFENDWVCIYGDLRRISEIYRKINR